jgi:divalent metal cation (Fe/Co/Zn/Cd) transporter
MKRNLENAKGLIMAEAVMIALNRKGMGRQEAHEVASQVEAKLSDKLSLSAVVHLEPATREATNVAPGRVEEAIDAAVVDVPQVVEIHGLNVHRAGGGGRIDLHVMLDRTQDLAAAHDLMHLLSARIEGLLPGFSVNLHPEPCSGRCKCCRRPCQVRGDAEGEPPAGT